MGKLKFWNREIGAFWIPFERKRIIEFSRVKADENISIAGYVKWISNNVFALIPTPFSNQIHLLCFNNTDTKPIENSYISISGRTRRFGLTSFGNRSRLFNTNLLVEVDSWKNSKSNFKIPKDEIKYEDFKHSLTFRIEGLEKQIRDFLAFTTISSPPIMVSLAE